MVGHGGLAKAQRFREKADRRAPIVRVEDDAQELQSGRVGNGSKCARQLLRRAARQRRVDIALEALGERHVPIIPANRSRSMSTVPSMRGVSVLADPTRAAILRLILNSDDGRVLVGRTAAELGLRQPTVSHHMRTLLDEGIVDREPAGRLTWYRIAHGQRDRIAALLRDDPVRADSVVDLGRIVDDLQVRFGDRLGRELIEACVLESHALLADSSHPRHLSARTAAFAAERLGAGLPDLTARAPEVLFVCVQNAGRSQIAAAVLRHLAGERVRVRTAGSAPAPELRESVVTALEEIGIPLAGEFPKPLTVDAVRGADVIVTMGCGDVCAHYAGKIYLDWDVDDPVGRSMRDIRLIRDDIDARTRALLGDLLLGDTSR